MGFPQQSNSKGFCSFSILNNNTRVQVFHFRFQKIEVYAPYSLILLNPFHGWNPHCFKSYPYFSGVCQLDTVFDKRSNLEWIASDADFSSIFRLNLGSIWSSKAWTPTAGRRWRCTMPAISCGSRFRPTRQHPPAPGVRPVAVSQGRLPSGNQTWKILHLKIIFPIKTFICKGFSVAMFDHRKATTKNHGRIKPSYGYMSDGI